MAAAYNKSLELATSTNPSKRLRARDQLPPSRVDAMKHIRSAHEAWFDSDDRIPKDDKNFTRLPAPRDADFTDGVARTNADNSLRIVQLNARDGSLFMTAEQVALNRHKPARDDESDQYSHVDTARRWLEAVDADVIVWHELFNITKADVRRCDDMLSVSQRRRS